MGEEHVDPFVGPEPFQADDAWRFFGRTEQAEELFALVVASRSVLLFAPSGAGKTSLVNAGLLPLVREEGWDILPPARVHGILPADLEQDAEINPYVFFTLMSWRGESTEPGIDPRGSLRDALAGYPRQPPRFGSPVGRLVVFDQFEELFTSFPEHWEKRPDFFRQLVGALEDDPNLRVLFSIREDYLADLLAVADLMPDGLPSRVRLDRLGQDAAAEAIEGPVRKTTRSFAEGVVGEIVEELLKVRVEKRPGESIEIVGEFVEPVQLQVVCAGLWKSLPPGTTVITSEHAQRLGDVDAALTAFYDDAVREAARSSGAWRRLVRDWSSFALITAAGTRAMVYRGVHFTEGMPNAAVDALENLHIIRAENRAGGKWCELTHDRFIRPIQTSNRTTWERERRRLLAVMGAATILVVAALVGIILLTQHNGPLRSVFELVVAAAATIWVLQLSRLVNRAPARALGRARLVAKGGRKARIGINVIVLLLLSAIAVGTAIPAARALGSEGAGTSFILYATNADLPYTLGTSYYYVNHSCGRSKLGIALFGPRPRAYTFTANYPTPASALRREIVQNAATACNDSAAPAFRGGLVWLASVLGLGLVLAERRRPWRFRRPKWVGPGSQDLRRPLRVTAAIGITSAVVLAIGVWGLHHPLPADPTPPPPELAPVALPSAFPGYGLTGALSASEGKLLSLAPARFVATAPCSHLDVDVTKSRNIDAAIQCDVPGAIYVSYAKFQVSETASGALSATIDHTNSWGPKDSSLSQMPCGLPGPDFAGVVPWTRIDGPPLKQTGVMACWISQDRGWPYLSWTYDTPNVVATAYVDPTKYPSVYEAERALFSFWETEAIR